ncbi:MAG: thioesterase family protein [Nocardioidaceae bacterium]|nr:thioesterase family protein [Nocardioidaceae bacterium]
MDEQPTPFSAYRTQVRVEWLDYNGHMHDASYAIVLSDANEEVFAALGLSVDYRATAGASFYTVECHIRYLAECSLGQGLSASTIMVAADERKLRLYTELLHEDGRTAATGDSLYLHVDTALGATTAMPSDRHDCVQDMLCAHAGLPRPAHLGLGVGAARAGSGNT